MFLDTGALFGAISVAGVPLLALTLGLVQWVKTTFLLEGRGAKITSLATGLILGFGYQLSVAIPAGFASWFSASLFGLALGLTASGIYDVAKQIANDK